VNKQKAKSSRQKKKLCLIVLDGVLSKKLLLKYLNPSIRSLIVSDSRFRLPEQTGGNDKGTLTQPVLISADGVSNKLHQWKIIPDYIIGDLDSITPKALAYFKKKKVNIKRVAEQEHNDFEKCIKYAISEKLKDITVIGYGGKRADHMLNNFSIMKRYYKKCRIRFIDKDFEVFFAGKNIEFNCKIGDTVSLMAMPKAGGISTYGLQYPLKNESLEFGIREGALNKAVSNKVRIKVQKGDLVVFKKFHPRPGYPESH
jgi:thiamine pyrophosphokinase